MKIALLASGQVGLEVASHFRECDHAPALVVTSAQDITHGEMIRSALPCTAQAVWGNQVKPEQVKQLHSHEVDLIISAWWPFILRSEVFMAARLGTLNFHPSMLPHGRGKHPNFWAIVEGTPFGVTLQFIDPGVDTGDIAFQQEIAVEWQDTGGSLHRKACIEIVQLFKKHFDRILAGDIPRIPQDAAAGRLHLSRELDAASQIHPEKLYKGREMLNLLRARTYPPFPGCWFADEGLEYEVRVTITPRKPLSLPT